MSTTSDWNFIIVLLVIWTISGVFIFFSMMEHKQKIDVSMRKKGATSINVSWIPWDFDRNHLTYKVTYEDSTGKKHQATCKMQIFRSTIYWEDEP